MMKSYGNGYTIIILLSVLCAGAENAVSPQEIEMHDNVVLERSKRQLLWPNMTLLQFNVGLATPTPLKTVAVNWAFQANFMLPWNRTQIPVDVLYANTGYGGASRSERDAYFKKEEMNDTSANGYSRNYADAEMGKILFEDSKNRYESDTGLYQFYKYVADMLNGFGYNGTDCVLQALCQLGAEPLHSDDEEDLVHELASFVLNPNNDVEDHPLPPDHEAHQFMDAYNRGHTLGNCLSSHTCSLSLVDMFTVLQG